MKKVFLLLLCMVLAGCAHPISKESMSLVDTSVTFPMLRENPDAYQGRFVLLGGSVASVTNAPKESRIEVVQLPLESNDMPEDTHRSDGRFLAVSDRFLDPLIYKEGKKVTIVGDVRGAVQKRLDQMEYRYPVIGIREIHLWRAEDYERQAYPPAAYPYFWYDPWWPYGYYRPGPFRPW